MAPHIVSFRRPYQRIQTKSHCAKICDLLKKEAHAAAATDQVPQPNAIIYHRGALDANRFDTDVELDYRQESYFFYLTGVEDPGYHVVIEVATNQVHLITPEMDEIESLWKAPIDSPTKLLQKYDVDQVHDERELPQLIARLKPTVIYTLDITDTTLLPPMYASNADVTQLRAAMDECRLIKYVWEIQLLRQVCHASSRAHMALMQSTKYHRHESELMALFQWFCVRHGLSRQAYIPIVLSGRRASILHETRHHQNLPPSNDPHAIVLVDAGGERSCYGTDITRCYPANGKFSPEAKTIYEIVLRMQQSVLSSLKEGVMWADMEYLAKRILVEEMVRIGIMNGDVDMLMDRDCYLAFYYHSLGHSVGLDVHDVGGRHRFVLDDVEQRTDFLSHRPLEANMVVTVEPGVYFNETAIRTWTSCPGYEHIFDLERIRQYSVVGGIRLEDTVLITKNGIENLTIVPKSVDEIERLMAATQDLEGAYPYF
ncbi:peptidase M24, structural domain-containing protein [Gongronella butleri]|nr:peptidase M24, structural domain-containing protein [Gongronella butleri]